MCFVMVIKTAIDNDVSTRIFQGYFIGVWGNQMIFPVLMK